MYIILRVYDLSGRLIRTLLDTDHLPLTTVASWDGKDDKGNDVAAGIYFYRLEAGNFTSTRKMTLIR